MAKSDDRQLAFSMTVLTLNAGLRTREDMALVLEDAARVLREFSCTPKLIAATVRDVNGNTVGEWKLANAVEEEDRDAE